MSALDRWTVSIRAIRAQAHKERDVIYERWLNSNMMCDERDNLMAGVNAWEDAAVKLEQNAYIRARSMERE